MTGPPVAGFHRVVAILFVVVVAFTIVVGGILALSLNRQAMDGALAAEADPEVEACVQGGLFLIPDTVPPGSSSAAQRLLDFCAERYGR